MMNPKVNEIRKGNELESAWPGWDWQAVSLKREH